LAVIVSQSCKANMKMRAVRIDAPVFSALPIKDWAHNLSVVNNVFNPLISPFGAVTDFLY